MNGKKSKSNKGLITLVIILLIAIIGLIGYIVYDKLNNDNSEGSEVTKSNVLEKEEIEARDLTEEELNSFKEHFNKMGINGFLIQEYTNIEDIDLYILLYNGIGKQTTITDAENNDFLTTNGMEELYTNLLKITDDDIKEFLETNAGLNHTKGEAIKNFTYLSKYDAYYNMHGDTNYMEVGSCISGKIDESGNYILNCKFKYDDMQTQTTLKKKDNDYIFISNKCSGNCEYLPGNIED